MRHLFSGMSGMKKTQKHSHVSYEESFVCRLQNWQVPWTTD
jgi:hypothetical protein